MTSKVLAGRLVWVVAFAKKRIDWSGIREIFRVEGEQWLPSWRILF